MTTIGTIETILRMSEILTSQQVNLHSHDGTRVHRDPHHDQIFFLISTVPHLQRVTIGGMDINLRQRAELVDFVLSNVADAAATLRGRVFRELLFGWKERPLHLLEHDKPTSDAETITLAERLGEALTAIARGDLAERIGTQLLERFQRGL